MVCFNWLRLVRYQAKYSLLLLAMAPLCLLAWPVFAIEVLPGQTTMVDMSESDINRIICPQPVTDAIYSKEKGISVRYVGHDVFVKFLVSDSDRVRPGPTELFLVCDNDVYTLILNPIGMPLQTIYLSSGIKKRVETNRLIFEGLAYEEKISRLVHAVLTDRLSDGFRVSKETGELRLFHQVRLNLNRIIYIEGEGLRIKEYIAELIGESPVTLQERDFLKKEVVSEPIALSIETPHLTPTDSVSRILIIERTEDD